MNGKNWNSKTKQHTQVVRKETIEKAKSASKLKDRLMSVAEIAKVMKLSESRIRELLK